MKSVPIFSIKGGTGKSTVTAGLGIAFRDLGLRVGFADFDYYGSNLPTALGIHQPFPHVQLDTGHQKMLAVKTDGYEIFSLAFRFGTTAAIMLQGGEEVVKAFGQTFHLRGTGTYELVKQMIAHVEFSELDYLLLDLPPTSGDITISLFENIKDLWGVILVCQPTNLAVQDIERTLDMVEAKRIPLLGLVENMKETHCPYCGQVFSPFLDGGIDLAAFCKNRGIPYLASIPLTQDKKFISTLFAVLANLVLTIEPVKIWDKGFKRKLEAVAIKSIVKGVFS